MKDLSPAQLDQLRIRERMKNWPEKDVIMAWYRSEEPFELTGREELIRQRWAQAKALFLQFRPYQEVCDELMREFEISIAQARRDIANSMQCFGDLDRVPKEAHRQRAIEMALNNYKKAENAEDYDAMAKATKNYIIAAGIDKDDVDKIDLEKLMRERVYVEVLDPVIRDLFLNFIAQSGGVIDVGKLYEQAHGARDREDYVNYEDVSEDDEDEVSNDV